MTRRRYVRFPLDKFERAAFGRALCIVSPKERWPSLIGLHGDMVGFSLALAGRILAALGDYREGCKDPEIQAAADRLMERVLIYKDGHPLELLALEGGAP